MQDYLPLLFVGGTAIYLAGLNTYVGLTRFRGLKRLVQKGKSPNELLEISREIDREIGIWSIGYYLTTLGREIAYWAFRKHYLIPL